MPHKRPNQIMTSPSVVSCGAICEIGLPRRMKNKTRKSAVFFRPCSRFEALITAVIQLTLVIITIHATVQISMLSKIIQTISGFFVGFTCHSVLPALSGYTDISRCVCLLCTVWLIKIHPPSCLHKPGQCGCSPRHLASGSR